MPKIYTIKDLQGLLKISRRTALGLVQDEHIKSFKVGREWRVTEQALLEWIESKERG